MSKIWHENIRAFLRYRNFRVVVFCWFTLHGGCIEHGTTVTMDDVALVENARELRSLEESSTLTGSKKRAQTVENIERCRWFYREQEIEEYDLPV